MITTIYGQLLNPKTEEWLRMINPSLQDKMLGVWRDGRPLLQHSEMTVEGDSTVLVKSATIPAVSSHSLFANHTELVNTDQGITKILTLLGVQDIEPTASQYQQPTPMFALAVHSPVKVKITAPDGEVGFQAQNPLQI